MEKAAVAGASASAHTSCVEDTDLIVSLINKPFRRRTQLDQQTIINAGRPTPPIFELVTDKRKGHPYKRSFKFSWYESNKWLDGSISKNKLYCWPCMLLSNKRSVWVSDGFYDLKNLSRGVTSHTNTEEHIRCQVGLKGLEKCRAPITELLSDHARLCKAQYYENVRKNRELLKRLIDLTVLLCKCEQPFRAHDESTESLNRGNFKETFYAFIKHDNEVKKHCEELGGNFTGLSKTIQNELIECLEEQVADFVKLEINKTPFFSVQVDDTTDIAEKSQCSIITRFVDENGDIQERFLGFHDVSKDSTANGLYEVVTSVLEGLSYREKLIAQCYDGASVMAGALGGLQAKIRTQAPEALFIHCAAHRLNLVLQNGSVYVKETLVFFSLIQNFPTFFHTSAKRSEVLSRIVGKRIPSHTEVRWSSNSKVLAFIRTHRDALISVFRDVTEVMETSPATRSQADSLLTKLNDFHFVFLLLVYSDIFKITDVLFDILQKKLFDVNYCFTQIQRALKNFKECRTDMRANEYIDKAKLLTGPPPATRGPQVPYRDKYRKLYFEIIDNISAQLDTRFSDIQKLEFLTLVDTTRFVTYAEYGFPESAFSSLKKFYASRFDFNRLKSELQVIYADPRFASLSASAAIKLLISSELNEILGQVYVLFCLVATIPATSSSVERSFSCLKRVKTYLRNTMTQERLSAMSKLSIEKALLSKLEAGESWYDDIITRFAGRKERRIDLIYKK